ncbi:glycoside hydrolase family 31 protein [Neolewinella antarctica]|uniref:Alpha-glucosidase n=1 Tax=Neolewinella antarctica TaxID=442734 RepID=A0ABX0X7U4_9BACT|nr:TIM-barrel domain-containing protein [Neolewinella antarctica]NJC25054.1 alpha-glucosidase [Neolewinella antarctica]
MTKLTKKPRHAYAPDPKVTFEGDTVNTARYDDVYNIHRIGKVTDLVETGKQTYTAISDGKANLHLQFWSDDVVRIRITLGKPGRDFSYGMDPAAQPTSIKVTRKEGKKAYGLSTGTIRLEINKADGRLKITDKATQSVIQEYTEPFYARTTVMKGLEQVRIQVATDKKEGFFGMGDKAWDTDLQGTEWSNYNEDAFAYHRGRKTNYRTIPFYYGLRDGKAYGVFLDNTYRSHFDFNSTSDDLCTVWADGGEMNYYFIYGPQLDDVAARYHHLTGVPELPPLWAMGFHQCRWSYYPESRVRELAGQFRSKRIPCDAIYLDIDYMDEYRCFTWDKKHFPDPKGMISDLKKDGFHTVVMIDPGIRVDENYPVYQQMIEHDYDCKRPNGNSMVGPVWPPECVWPDYTNPAVREWWGPLYRELYNEQGVSGFWNDMNEPAMFKVNRLTFPDDIRHDMDGQPTDHKEAHNIYGLNMTRASYDGLKKLQPAKRPFLLGRASYSGGQRYAALWTGDNIASWEHLQIANRQCIRMAISGFSMVGTDIGGFVDDPTPEMLTRWLQLAVFHPLMRIHSMGNNADGAAGVEAEAVKKAEAEDRKDQEPWAHGKEHTKRNRRAIEMRYQLLPYLYSSFKKHLETGVPVLRNLFFYDQEDPQCRKFGDQFLYGDDLLVCPVLKEGMKSMAIYLPQGEWYDFWSGEHHTGTQKMKVKVKADRMPIFVKAGTVLPTVDVVQSTQEMHELSSLELSVFAAESGTSTFYWDAGEGYGHDAGQFTERTYEVTRKKGKIALRQTVRGSYNASFQVAEVRFLGLTAPPSSIVVDGRQITTGIYYGKKAVVVNVPFNFGEILIN